MIKALTLVVTLYLLLATGCASLPGMVPISEDEAQNARQSFSQSLSSQWSCPAAIDADVTVSFKSFLFSGTIAGYLQAMRPSSLRFEGVNPFGLTETVLVSDGSTFSYAAIREQQSYEGSLLSDTAKKYIPADLSTLTSYYWLLGKLPPGRVDIFNAGGDEDSANIWFDIADASGGRHKILYSVKDQVILRHLALNKAGIVDVDVSYAYNPSDLAVDILEKCALPQNIEVTTSSSAKIIIAITKLYPEAEISQDQFLPVIPSNFKRTVVK